MAGNIEKGKLGVAVMPKDYKPGEVFWKPDRKLLLFDTEEQRAEAVLRLTEETKGTGLQIFTSPGRIAGPIDGP